MTIKKQEKGKYKIEGRRESQIQVGAEIEEKELDKTRGEDKIK
jgi:hypothetical protein